MENRGQSQVASWLSIAAGIWLIAAPFILGYVTMAPRWNDIILGIIVAVLSIWSSGAANMSSSSHSTPRAHA